MQIMSKLHGPFFYSFREIRRQERDGHVIRLHSQQYLESIVLYKYPESSITQLNVCAVTYIYLLKYWKNKFN